MIRLLPSLRTARQSELPAALDPALLAAAAAAAVRVDEQKLAEKLTGWFTQRYWQDGLGYLDPFEGQQRAKAVLGLIAECTENPPAGGTVHR